MSVEQKLFFCMCIRANKFRFNYGRQANKTLRELPIPDITEVPDWVNGAFKGVLTEWTTRLSGLGPTPEGERANGSTKGNCEGHFPTR
jgi:hypothetical protein